MKNDTATARRIAQLASRLSPDILTGLWILRSASPDYAPAYEQMGLFDMLAGYSEPALVSETPWHTVLQASEANRLTAAAQALSVILPQSPLAERLACHSSLIPSQNAALEELISVLSSISPKDTALSQLFPGQKEGPTLLSEAFDIPNGILHLLLSLMEIREHTRLYDPCYGGGSLLARSLDLLPQKDTLLLCAQALDYASYQAGAVQSYLHGVSLELGDGPAETLTKDLHPESKFHCILANPPFNHAGWYHGIVPQFDPRWQYGIPPRSNGNFAWLQHVVFHLAPEGKGAIILPNGTLSTQTQSEREIRIRLLQAGLVEAIIALPAGIFSATKVPCCIWLLSGSPRSGAPVLFVDAQQLSLSEETSEDVLKLTGLIVHHRRGLIRRKTTWYAQASLEEIAERDYILSPNFYTLSPALALEPLLESRSKLTSLLKILAPQIPPALRAQLEWWQQASPAVHWDQAPLSQLYSISGGIVKKKEAFGHGIPMADVVTVIRNAFLPEVLSSRVEVSPEELQKFRIQAGDILMNRSSENVEELACCCAAAEDREAVFSGYLKRLRPVSADCPDSRYMAAYFRSAIYRQEITKVSPVYTTRSNINMKQLQKVLAYYPDKKMQEVLGETMLAVFRFQETCFDQALSGLLEQFNELLIQQFITYPILRMQKTP